MDRILALAKEREQERTKREREAQVMFTENVKLIQERTGWNQLKLAHEIGLSRINLCRWVNRRRFPTDPPSLQNMRLVQEWAEILRNSPQPS